jgi:hypothetical protein
MAVDAENGQAVWASVPRRARDAGGPRPSPDPARRAAAALERPPRRHVHRRPRPERPEFHELLSTTIPFWFRRHLLKPGITGWAQLHAGYARDTWTTEEKLSYDLWYLRHRSLVLDFIICVKTIPELVRSGGR